MAVVRPNTHALSPLLLLCILPPSVRSSVRLHASGYPHHRHGFCCTIPPSAAGIPGARAVPLPSRSVPARPQAAALSLSHAYALLALRPSLPYPSPSHSVCVVASRLCRRLRSPPVCHVRRGSVPVPCSPPLVVMCSGAQCNTRMKLRIALAPSGVGPASVELAHLAIFAYRLIRYA